MGGKPSLHFYNRADRLFMTAQVILLRHGKSDWDTLSSNDFDRSVSARGIRQLPLIAEQLLPLIKQNSRIICSPAVRTRESLSLVTPFWPVCEIIFDARIYEAETAELYACLKDYGDCASLIMIGHNPGLVMLLNMLLSEGEFTPEAAHLPTSSAAVISSNVATCSVIAPHSANLVTLLKPKA
jgi:phosphohistidine phosphatase